MRSEITMSLSVALDPNSFVYVTHFEKVPFLMEIADMDDVFPFWQNPWVDRFYHILESERSIKVMLW